MITHKREISLPFASVKCSFTLEWSYVHFILHPILSVISWTWTFYVCKTVLLPVLWCHIALWHYPRCSWNPWISRGRLKSHLGVDMNLVFLNEIIRAFYIRWYNWGIKKKRFCAILGRLCIRQCDWGIKKKRFCVIEV